MPFLSGEMYPIRVQGEDQVVLVQVVRLVEVPAGDERDGVVVASSKSFDELIGQSDKPVLVDFYAE